MARGNSMVWSSILVCGAQLSQQQSGTCLSHTLKVVYSTLLGLLINASTPLTASGEFAQEPIYGWSPSANGAVLFTCADIIGVSPYQMYIA